MKATATTWNFKIRESSKFRFVLVERDNEWILRTGYWDNTGVWDNAQNWKSA